MKLFSDYLNPFQPFPERDLHVGEKPRIRNAIEDNLTRAVFSALVNSENSQALAVFLRHLASYGDGAPQQRIKRIAERIHQTEHSKIQVGLQSQPFHNLVGEHRPLEIVLIGISSSHLQDWSHDARFATDSPRPDAWIYLPGQFLILFECKSDEHPLDATQILSYIQVLRLFDERSQFHFPEPGTTLTNSEAKFAQDKCSEIVLDAKWTHAVAALKFVAEMLPVESLGSWLCKQAVDYLHWHLLPKYEGIGTIIDWLGGPDTPDRCRHLRTLVEAFGKDLSDPASAANKPITFTESSPGTSGLYRGASAAVYVKLQQSGLPLTGKWLERSVDMILAFAFAQDESDRIGLELYLQAAGSQARALTATDWNEARQRHYQKRQDFEDEYRKWAKSADPNSVVEVSTVRFRGQKWNWHGGGVYQDDGKLLFRGNAQEALQYLEKNRDELWAFSAADPSMDSASIRKDLAPGVRKPAVSLIAPLDVAAFRSCGSNPGELHDFLWKAIQEMMPHQLQQNTSTESGKAVDPLQRQI